MANDDLVFKTSANITGAITDLNKAHTIAKGMFAELMKVNVVASNIKMTLDTPLGTASFSTRAPNLAAMAKAARQETAKSIVPATSLEKSGQTLAAKLAANLEKERLHRYSCIAGKVFIR